MMNELKNSIYIVVISLLGMLTIVSSFLATERYFIVAIIVLSFFAVAAESLSVTVIGKSISVSSAIILCGLMSYGPFVAISASAFSILLRVRYDPETGRLHHLFNTHIKKTVFNTSMYILSSASASYAYILLGGQTLFELTRIMSGDLSAILSFISQQSLFIIIAIFADILTNTLMMAGYFHTSGRGQLLQEWIHDFFWSFAGLIVVGLLGVLLTAFYLSYGWFVVLIFFAPLFLARYTFSLYSNLRVSYMDTVKSLSDAIEAKDLYTRGHSQRVQEYSELIAEELRFTPKQREVLQYAALLHDVGKIGVAEVILNKPGKLDHDEFDSIKQHPVLGARIISNVKYLKDCVPIIKYHHKYFDGSGYPELSADEKIPYEAYILSVADAYDAMTSQRQYRDPFTQERALQEIEECAGTQFDPSVASAFLKAMSKQSEKESAHVTKVSKHERKKAEAPPLPELVKR